MPNKNPSPKSVFLQNERLVKAHARMVESQDFQTAIDVAKSHYIRRLHDVAPTDLNAPNFMSAAAVSFERVQGMMDFIDILINLGEHNPPPAMVKDDINLAPPGGMKINKN
jgi:hypothetical protein